MLNSIFSSKMIDASIAVDSVFYTFIRAEISDMFAIKLVDFATQVKIIQNNVTPLFWKKVSEEDLNAVLDVSATEMLRYDLSAGLAIIDHLQTIFDGISRKVKSLITYVKLTS